MKPVGIVGAGIAGLACARALKRQRVPFLIVEAGDGIGGRIRTDVIGNYRLDRGYQVLFTAYPHAKDQLDYDKLDLLKVQPGAYIVWDGEQHLVTRENRVKSALSGFISTSDKLRLGKWTSDIQWLDRSDIDELPDRSTEQYLREEGFSSEFIERFARPFFGGLFLDRSLSTSCRQAAFVWKSITEGDTAVPALGMEEIPNQLAATFGHEVLRLNAPVLDVLKTSEFAYGVTLQSGEEIEADAVILATDAATASQLSGVPIQVDYRHSITLYFTAPMQPIEGAWLVINGNMRGVTNHVMPVSNVTPFAEPIEKHLVSATILGERTETDEQLAEIVAAEMRVWFPERGTDDWEFLRGYRCQNAQMVQPPGFQHALPSNDSGIPGLYFAGEYTTNSSIDGAIQSGLECAELVAGRVAAGVA